MTSGCNARRDDSTYRRIGRAMAVATMVAAASPSGVIAQATANGPTVNGPMVNGPTVSVSGVAFDSLTLRPLPGALVFVEGAHRTAIADDKGRFKVDSVPIGSYLFQLQHAAFDSIGLAGRTVRVEVSKNTPRVTLALPSFGTLWRAVCGDGPAPKDSVLVFGTVRNASTSDPVPNTVIAGSWVDLVGGGASLASVGQRRWRREAATDERGEYALCGVPPGTAVVLDVVDSALSAHVELDASAIRVRRRDVLVSAAASAASAPTNPGVAPTPGGALTASTGTVSGVVTNAAGLPVANAVIAIDSMPEVRSSADGRFSVSGVAVGTRAVAIVAIGLEPHRSLIDVRPGDTTRVTIPMPSVQTLSQVNVRAKANTVFGMRERMIDEHKTLGLGSFRDSTEIAKHTSMRTVMNTLPGIEVRGTTARFSISAGRACPVGMFRLILDGHPSQIEELALIDTRNVAVMEVYKRLYPSDLLIPKGCTIVVWTKGALGK